MTQIPTVTAPAATSGGGKTQTSTYLAIVAALAGLALLAGLVGLFLTRDRTLPAVAGGAPVPPAPLDPPEPAGYWTPPQNDVEHDWGSQTPGPPPPPPPPPGPYEE